MIAVRYTYRSAAAPPKPGSGIFAPTRLKIAQFQAASCDTIIGPLEGIAYIHHSGDAAAEKGFQLRATTRATGDWSKARHRKGGVTGIKALVFDKVRESLMKIV